MPAPDRTNTPYTRDSEQGVLNKSQDIKYDVLAVELLAENTAGTALVRLKTDTSGNLVVSGSSDGLTDTQLRATPVPQVDANKQSVLYYARVLTASTTLAPTLGKKIKLLKMQVLQSPDNTTANQVTLNFTSTGDFFTGWVGSDSSEVIGATNEALNITLGSSSPISVLLRYKEIT